MFQVDSNMTMLVLTDLILFLCDTAIIYANNIKVNCLHNLKPKSLTYKSIIVTNSQKCQMLFNGVNSVIVPNNYQIIR